MEKNIPIPPAIANTFYTESDPVACKGSLDHSYPIALRAGKQLMHFNPLGCPAILFRSCSYRHDFTKFNGNRY
jgi:hypothetical protein